MKVFACFFLLAFLIQFLDAQGFSKEWDKVKALEDEQKYSEALKQVEAIYTKAVDEKNEQEWTKSFLRMVGLKRGLSSYEEAVKLMMEKAWPQGENQKAIVHLFYAITLMDYYYNYSWEINRREKVASEKGVDLKKWTAYDIFEEINRQYSAAYQYKEALGDLKVATYKEYIQRNGYPDHIAATLRDFLVYQWVAFLGNTNTWRPYELQEKHELDFASLASLPESRKAIASEDLSKLSIHPVLRMVSLLDELYRWNLQTEQNESALESQLTRIEKLSSVFDKKDQKELLKTALGDFLKNFVQYPWWAAGQVQYASFLQTEGNLIEARKIALAAHEKYPTSLGGQRCLHLAKTIEIPDFQLQNMSVDRPGVPSLMIEHKNMSKLYLRAYKLDFDDWMSRPYRYLGSLYSDDVREEIASSSPEVSWSVDLPNPGDYKNHKTYVVPKMKAKGFYLIVASVFEDFRNYDSKKSLYQPNKIMAAYMMISDMITLATSQGSDWEVFVVDGKTGARVSGAKVTLYSYDYNKGARRVSRLVTNKEGVIRFPYQQNMGGGCFVVAEKGDDISFDPQSFYFAYPSQEGLNKGCFIYTDRSVYRPLQKIYFKVVTYEGSSQKGTYKTLPNKDGEISFFDPNSKIIEKKKIRTNDYGTASGEFTIPTGRVLGQYRFQCQVQYTYGTSYFRVEEYKRPTFEVTLKKPGEALRLNEKITVKGEARYYFGLPVTTGKVVYRVTRETVWPWWYWWFYNTTQDRSTYEVAAGNVSLEKDGSFTIPFVPKADPSLAQEKEITYHFKVEATVTDEGGETRNASQSYPIGFVAIRADLQMSSNYFLPTDTMEISVLRTDLSNVPRAGKGEYRLVELQQPKDVMLPQNYPIHAKQDEFSTPGDKQRPRWEGDKTLEQYLYAFEDGKTVTQDTLTHEADGKALVSLKNLPSGVYRLYYSTRDAWNTLYETRKEFVVAGENLRLAVPFFLLTRQDHVSVGEKAHVLFGSGIAKQSYWLEVYQSNKLVSRDFFASGQSQIIEIPVQDQQRGGFSIRLFGAHDYRVYMKSENVHVPWDNKNLQISFERFRNHLSPGQKETWTVNVKGANSETVMAEVLAYMYDRSLDFFAPHQYPRLEGLFASKIGVPGVRGNVHLQYFTHIYNQTWYDVPNYAYWSPDSFIAYSSYPIGGLGTREYYRGKSKHYALSETKSLDVAPAPSMVTRQASKNGKMKAKEEAKMDMVADGTPEPEAPMEPSSTPTAPAKEDAVPLRSNFAETAFFQPHLLTDSQGNVSVEFTVPDSVTSWNFYTHAITKDLSFMTEKKEVATRKDLMVRPYVPRFFREGDEAVLKVVINNATEKPLFGKVTLSILDSDTQEDKSADFKLAMLEQPWNANGKDSTNVSWKLVAPHKMGTYSFKVVGRSAEYSDGELRPLPVLPSRIHLVQSKFVTLKENQTRTLYLADLEKSLEDKTLVHQSLVLSVDAQLIYSVLKSLPYLAEYPYECMEQTLNRFMATGIVTAIYRDYPAISRMAKEFSVRQTQYEAWFKEDANRKMTLEETPWLQLAEGGDKDMARLANVLDETIAKARRDDALDKLTKAQIGNGAFPWWAGGPPSPYMTLYIVYGFAKAKELGVEIPKEMVRKAWVYLASYFREYYAQKLLVENYGWEFIAFLNYTLSCYQEEDYRGSFTQEERKQMLDYAFRNWKKMSPYIKAYLSLTLMRMDRPKEAQLVLESIMDSAITKEDQGTFWAPEDRGWLWYNDNIESHAFALRALQEVKPQSKDQIDGLVLWLLLNKKCNQWKSTKATAEVLYSLLYTLKQQNALGVRETAEITLGSQKHEMVFEPDRYTGAHNQIIVPGQDIVPQEMAKAQVHKTGPGYMFASMTWHYSTEQLPKEERGDFLSVKRNYFLRKHEGKEYILIPLEEVGAVSVGDEIEVHLSIRSKHPMEYVHLRDPRGAGFEPENQKSGHHWEFGICWYEEVRDSGSNFFFENLPQGEYTFKYRLRANMAGQFRVGPATLQGMYAPEFAAFSTGAVLKVK